MKLNRVVALKMILAGAHAGPQERLRFLAEGEAIAAIKHPGIIEVHDFGTHGDLPFFALEYCDGGSLADKLAGNPLAPREAVGVVEPVARAIQAAHDKGIVHRDLKPGNVLLTGDGRLKVSDFGLARRVEGGGGLTQSGAVVGTPSYMAPEQASGVTKRIGPAVDVYALGAILYECLTGRPPFRAATELETLVQVMSDEPVSPRQLNATVPGDLETVCLKCLRKEPERRYASAAALAEDLRRWQAGEPIQARPAGRVERGVKWMRRNPVVAALLGVSGVAVLALVGLTVGLFYNAKLSTAYEKESSARLAEEHERRRAENALGVAEEARRGEATQRQNAVNALALAERLGYFHSVSLADVALKENDTHMAFQRLRECKAEQQGWEWRHLNAQLHTELFSLPGTVTFSPDGKRAAVAVSEPPGGIRICDARTGREVVALKGPVPPGTAVFSPDGTRIAVVPSQGGVVRVYDARSGKGLLTLQGKGRFYSPTFSPDGTHRGFAAERRRRHRAGV
jgi:hypothetical protein